LFDNYDESFGPVDGMGFLKFGDGKDFVKRG
jgi:hypothetical protein